MNKLHNELKKLSFVVGRRSSLVVVGGFITCPRDLHVMSESCLCFNNVDET